MTADDLIALNDQLAGMARAGLPLDRGLASLAREMGRGRLRTVTAALADDLGRGVPLPEALDAQKGLLPPYYAALVSAGVRTGRLPDVLATLTNYARSVAQTRAVVVESLFYPAVVLALAAALLALFGFGILPLFAKIFDDFGLQLPLLTRAVISLRDYWFWVLGFPFSFGFAAVTLWAVLRTTPSGRRTWSAWVYAVPLVGSFLRAARMASFTELLALMVEHAIPLPEAFRLAGEASADPLVADHTDAVAVALGQGVPLGEALGGRGLVPAWVAWMVGAGADRGALGPALRQVAGLYRRQAEGRAALLRTVVPPFLIVGTAGVIVGVFAVALFLPLVKLLEGLSK